MLGPERLRMVAAANDPMRILDVRTLPLVGRHIGGPHPLRGIAPTGPGIAGGPGAAAGNADDHAPAVFRMESDRVEAGCVIAAAEPVGLAGDRLEGGVLNPG